jgi:hypothetical protein
LFLYLKKFIIYNILINYILIIYEEKITKFNLNNLKKLK